jgi:hypothetical protein
MNGMSLTPFRNKRLPESENKTDGKVTLHFCKRKNGLVKKTTLYLLSLQAGQSGDRIPVEARFSAPVQICTRPHPTSLYNGYQVITGGTEAGGGVKHPIHLSPRLKEE